MGLIRDELIQCLAPIPVSAAFVADKDPNQKQLPLPTGGLR
jgi:hypothetical protein